MDEIKADYQEYRKQCPREGITRPMDFETFTASWLKEADMDDDYFEHMEFETRRELFI